MNAVRESFLSLRYRYLGLFAYDLRTHTQASQSKTSSILVCLLIVAAPSIGSGDGFLSFSFYLLLLLFRFFYCHLMCFSLLGFQLCHLKWFFFPSSFIYHCKQPLQLHTLDFVIRVPLWKTAGFSLRLCIWFVEWINFLVRLEVVGLFN